MTTIADTELVEEVDRIRLCLVRERERRMALERREFYAERDQLLDHVRAKYNLNEHDKIDADTGAILRANSP